jgi:hypothetical protein
MKVQTKALLLAMSMLSTAAWSKTPDSPPVDKLMAHYDRVHSGWDSNEKALTPATVSSGNFGLLWSSPQLDSDGDTPPRLFSTPLFLHALKLTEGQYRGATVAATLVTTTTGYAYAISTAASGKIAPGTILWRTKITEAPCNHGTLGNYGTGIIDEKASRFYVTSCANTSGENGKNYWSALALDIHSGKILPGWPVNISQTMMDQPALNRNGTRTWRFAPGYRWLQRGALNMSADGTRLYLAFGADAVGWMVVMDIPTHKVVSAFSSTPDDVQDGGGMWASGGPAVDPQGRLYVTTGANLLNGVKLGLEGMYPDNEHSWAQSILQFNDDRANGLTLTGTYTPYNYCQAGKADVDIGSSGVISLDTPAGGTATPNLLIMGGGKQGNIYLLDRDHMPGGTVKRHPCTVDPADDMSLLAPEVQPEWKRRAPINLFKPFSDEIGSFDQAKSRTTASYYRADDGTYYVYVTGASKTGVDFNDSMPPGLAKVKVFLSPGAPAFLRVDKLETTQTFGNAGSPIVSSNGGHDAIVWMVDQNAPRTTSLYGPKAPKPTLYAFDATDLKLLWKSNPGELFTTGNYGEPTVVNGLVLVGTDRIQAYGLKSK